MDLDWFFWSFLIAVRKWSSPCNQAAFGDNSLRFSPSVLQWLWCTAVRVVISSLCCRFSGRRCRSHQRLAGFWNLTVRLRWIPACVTRWRPAEDRCPGPIEPLSDSVAFHPSIDPKSCSVLLCTIRRSEFIRASRLCRRLCMTSPVTGRTCDSCAAFDNHDRKSLPYLPQKVPGRIWCWVGNEKISENADL